MIRQCATIDRPALRLPRAIPALPAARTGADRLAGHSARGAWWLAMLGVTLFGYALFGKGWAYIGLPPFLYIGEITLLCGIAVVARHGRLDGIGSNLTFLSLAALGLWGAYRTVPYLSQYGADALRDAVIWGYGAFAFVVYAFVLADASRLSMVARYYRRFCVIFVPAVPAVWLGSRYFEEHIPTWPWADAPIIDAKGGDVMVHLSGVLAFWVSGLATNVRAWRMIMLALCIAAVGAYNRGGLVAAMVVFAFCFAMRPAQPVLWRLVAGGVITLLLLAVTDVRIQVPGKGRELSFDQVISNITSITGDSEPGDGLSGTKEWRLSWWGDIYDYTVNGPYFWTGKGFGINLADDDGYQGTQWEGRLRSPHNGHLTFLARAGVPGFGLWMLVQGTWAIAMLAAYSHSRKRRCERWAGLFLFLLAYWLAFMVNSSFDVFLEGPMGGIWMWTILGIGLAAVRIYLTNPRSFEPTTAPL